MRYRAVTREHNPIPETSIKEGSRAKGSRAEGKNMDETLTPPNSDAPNTCWLANAAPATANTIKDYCGGLKP